MIYTGTDSYTSYKMSGFGSYCDSSSSSANCWIEVDVDDCCGYGYTIDSGTSATTIEYPAVRYKWADTASSAITYKIKVRPKQHIWCEAGAWFSGHKDCRYIPQKPIDRMREIIQARHAPSIIVARSPILTPRDEREIRARETLARVIGSEKYQRFLKDGFVSVRAKSGLVYQIFPGHGITSVYRDGQQIERLCVVLKGDFPPTDSLIMRYLIILNDESRFRSYAIKHQVIIKKDTSRQQDSRPLAEIFSDLKTGKRVA